MIKENVNYNINSRLGVDDLETVKSLKIPTAHAYTTGINDVAIAKIKENNFNATKRRILDEGGSLQEAEKEANKMANKGEQYAKKELAKVRKARGYV